MRRVAVVITALVLVLGMGVQQAGATFPARNGRIAFSTDLRADAGFSGGEQIYTVAPDGSGVRQLTHVDPDHNAVGPDWSPGGRRILYQSNVTGNWEIWVMRADGSNQTQLTNEPGFDHRDPRWSPDGSHIAFVRCDLALFGTACPLYTMRADGTGMAKLLGQNWIYAHPEYSPDGTRIAFDSNRGGYLSAIWTMNLDGTNLRRLTPSELEAFYPDWSPDGTHIVLTSYCCQARSDVWKMRADGSRLTRLTHFYEMGGRQGGFASYSPNGNRIVFTSNLKRPDPEAPFNDLFTMRPDGSDITAIVTNHPYLFQSDWGPTPQS